VDLVDQLLTSPQLDANVKELLERSRECLDNFDFAAVEPLLVGIEEALLA
jgi:hypothetical protein